jgi:hypothetical protein
MANLHVGSTAPVPMREQRRCILVAKAMLLGRIEKAERPLYQIRETEPAEYSRRPISYRR